MNTREVEARLEAVTAGLPARPADVRALRARLVRRRRERRLAMASGLAAVAVVAVGLPVAAAHRGDVPPAAPVALHEVDQAVALTALAGSGLVGAAEAGDATVYVAARAASHRAAAIYAIPVAGTPHVVGSLADVSGLAVGRADIWAHVGSTVVELDRRTGAQVHVWHAPAGTEIDRVVAAGDVAWVQLDVESLDPRLVRLGADGTSLDCTPADYFGSVPSPQSDDTAYVLSNTHLVHIGARGTLAQTSRGGLFAEADQVLGVVDDEVVVFTGERDDNAAPARLRAYDPSTLRLARTVTYRATLPSYGVDGSTADGLVALPRTLVAVEATVYGGASRVTPVDLRTGRPGAGQVLTTVGRPLGTPGPPPMTITGPLVVGADVLVDVLRGDGGQVVLRRVAVT